MKKINIDAGNLRSYEEFTRMTDQELSKLSEEWLRILFAVAKDVDDKDFSDRLWSAATSRLLAE
jgi:hypothetical protein